MRRSRPLLLLGLAGLATAAGCEPVEPMSHPFQRAPVATAPAAAPQAAAPESDDRFTDFDQTFVISSEELQAMAEPEPEPAEPTPAPAETPAEPVAPTPAAAPALLGMAHSAPMVAQVPAAPLGWAIRLVSTLPEAQPPRAILGLPSGQEIVVTPGSMIPEAGLVVLSIGTQGVQLARVQAMGDHANVDAISLTPQY